MEESFIFVLYLFSQVKNLFAQHRHLVSPGVNTMFSQDQCSFCDWFVLYLTEMEMLPLKEQFKENWPTCECVLLMWYFTPLSELNSFWQIRQVYFPSSPPPCNTHRHTGSVYIHVIQLKTISVAMHACLVMLQPLSLTSWIFLLPRSLPEVGNKTVHSLSHTCCIAIICSLFFS